MTIVGQGFNNAFVFGHKLVELSLIKELPDSSFLVCGHYLNQDNDRLGSLYFKLDQEGNLIDSLQVAQLGRSYLLGFARNELFFNHNGNIVVSFRNAYSGESWRQRVQEVDFTDFTLVSDVLLDTLAEHLNLRVFDGSSIIQNESDSTYLMFITTVDTSFNIGEPGWTGCNLVHLSSTFQILNVKKYFVAGWVLSAREIIQLSDDEFLLLLKNSWQSATTSLEIDHTIIKKVNAQGDELWSWESMDNQKDIQQRALTPTVDGGFLYTYFKGFPISNGWSYIPTLRKLNSNMQEDWSMSIGPLVSNWYWSFADIEAINDTLFVTVGGVTRINEIDIGQRGSRLLQFSLDGEKFWQREFFYFPYNYPDYWNLPDNYINDLALTSDGGYIMAGTAINYEFGETGNPTDYGWVIKLNCLGFMGAPEAAASYEIQDNFAVQFVNTSTQGGSYTWNFGDGTVLETGENADTVVHHYNGFGTYMVQVIAHGCNEESDTLEFFVSPKLHANPYPVTEGEGYFTFFPNPVVSGNPFYVYLNDISTHNGKEVKLRFHNNSGQHVTDYRLSCQQGAYMINPTLASGVYHVGLYVGDEAVQVRKLVVD